MPYRSHDVKHPYFPEVSPDPPVVRWSTQPGGATTEFNVAVVGLSGRMNDEALDHSRSWQAFRYCSTAQPHPQDLEVTVELSQCCR
jgi:hypothetical protein